MEHALGRITLEIVGTPRTGDEAFKYVSTNCQKISEIGAVVEH